MIDQTIDLAILYSPIIHETLAQRFITNERILMAVRRDPALSWNQAERIHIREGTFNDLIDKPVIMSSSEQKLGRAVINFFSKLGYQPPIYTRAENTVTMLELAAYGCGICFTPDVFLLHKRTIELEISCGYAARYYNEPLCQTFCGIDENLCAAKIQLIAIAHSLCRWAVVNTFSG